MITTSTLIACGMNAAIAQAFAAPLTAAFTRFAIPAGVQQAAAIAHAMHESQRFEALSESLYYRDPARVASIFKTAFDLDHDGAVDPEEIEAAKPYICNSEKLANRAYAGRNGNGDEASGDGFRYRGRGPLQLTGRANYAAASAGIGSDYVAHPDLVGMPPDGAQTLAWFWVARGCMAAMKTSADFDATTRIVNGPRMLGAAERRAYFNACRQAMGC